MDYLSMAAEYARFIHYYNLSDRPDGDWADFIENDPAVVIAIIACADLSTFQSKRDLFARIENPAGIEYEQAWYKELFGFMMEWIIRVDKWYNQLSLLEDPGMITELENAIGNQFAPALHLLQVLNQSVGDQVDVNIPFHRLAPIWQSTFNSTIFGLLPPKSERFAPFSKEFWSSVMQVFSTFQNTLFYLVNKAPSYFDAALTSKKHTPNNALFIAFLTLYQHAQADINTLTQRHLDFYYKNVLRLKYLDGVPDSAYVVFQLAQGVQYSMVPQGTLLAAGKSASGQDIQFATLRGLEVNNVSVASICTLYIDNNSIFSAGTDEPVVSNIYMAPVANSQDGMGGALKKPDEGWPTFGLGRLQIDIGGVTLPEAAVGFMVSTPVLLLPQGIRKVSMVISFVNLELADGQTLNDLIGQMVENDEISTETALYRVFDQAFLLYITTANGWEPVPQYTASFDLGSMQLALNFQLDATAPPVVANPSCIPAGTEAMAAPMIKAVLDNNAPIYAYSFLNGLIISEINIDVDVSNVKDLVLYNQVGKLSAAKPFQPFGPVPEAGNYMMVGCPEVFQKKLTDLSFHIDWTGLPSEDGGFETYYAGYDLDITNDSFRVKLSVLTGNTWVPAGSAQRQELLMFETVEQDLGNGPVSVLSTTTDWNDIDLEPIAFDPVYNLPTPLVYDPFTQSGFFRFELSAPPYGFAHKQYSNALTSVATYNARRKEDLPLPNPPFVPVIGQMSLSYKAGERMILMADPKYSMSPPAEGGFYHIQPFGTHCLYSGKSRGSIPLVPLLQHQGSLFLGLKNLSSPDTLTLFLEFAEQKTPSMPVPSPTLTWSYLAKDTWVDFRSDQVVSDSTLGFMTSGIVELQIPSDISLDNTVFPGDQYWIRVAADHSAELFPSLINIFTNAVEVTWVNDGDTSRLGTPLPAGTIKKVAGKLPDIKTVAQPLASFGGQAPEDDTAFYTRVSERLRHKDRAIAYWDFERLVLQQFPAVFDVKCTNLDAQSQVTPSVVTIAVVPQHTGPELDSTPLLDTASLVEIQKYAEKHADPFIQINVCNPIYEKLLVNCEVQFTAGCQGGYYLQQLNTDLQEFLSPWYNSTGLQLTLGGSVDVNSILTYIENLSYVEHVTAFSVEQIVDNGGYFQLFDSADATQPKTILTATTPWSIFTSVKTHRLKMTGTAEVSPPQPAGVGILEIGEDFIIGEEELPLPPEEPASVATTTEEKFYKLKVTSFNSPA